MEIVSQSTFVSVGCVEFEGETIKHTNIYINIYFTNLFSQHHLLTISYIGDSHLHEILFYHIK